MTTTTIGASDKQIAFGRRLLAEMIGSEHVEQSMENVAALGHLRTTKTASAWIDSLLKAKKDLGAARAQRAADEHVFVTAGYFAMEGTIYKVVPSRSTGRNYAMSLAAPGMKKGTWRYEKGAMYRLTESMRLSLEQAKEYGRTHKFCVACGALLTDPKSVEQGIGPVCAKKF